MDRLLRGDLPPGGKCGIKTLAGQDGWGVETTAEGGRVVWARLELTPGEWPSAAS